MSRRSKAEKKARKNAATINDQYDESSRVLTDEEAHRNVSYELPSFPSQVLECFKVQMKRYTRQRVMWMCIILLALIPVIYYALKFGNISLIKPTDVANIYMASLLCFGGVTIPLLSCIACGTMLSQEFNERTVYLSLPLPISRLAFFVGKFLAGVVLIEGTIAAAYGISIIIAMSVTTTMYTTMLFESFILALTFGFFCCSFSYALSTKLKRGSSMLPFIIIFIVLPAVGIAVTALSDIAFLEKICMYIPTFEMDMAISCLGNTLAISTSGIITSMFYGMLTMSYSDNNMAVAAVSVLLSLILLGLGYRVIKRRDM